MLGENGEYFKLGSLGGDTETEEHVRARERREAIGELDREVREQNRAAAERASRAAGKKPEKPEKGRCCGRVSDTTQGTWILVNWADSRLNGSR